MHCRSSRIAYVFLVVMGLGACTSRNLGYIEDGGGGARDGGSDGATPDLAGVACAKLDEKSCAVSNCRADYCDLCQCSPSFMGCSDPADEPKGCPPIACDAPLCSCQQLDEKTCGTQPGCTPIYCEGQCDFAPTYIGCFGPNDGAPLCPPPPPCIPTCTEDAECTGGQRCRAGDEPFGCGGACQVPIETCKGDFDCATNEVCNPVECSCTPDAKACFPGCKKDTDCGLGEECEQRRCRSKSCSKKSDCPAQFTCRMNFDDRDQCRRTECMTDSACDGGFCIDNVCWGKPGMCEWLPG